MKRGPTVPPAVRRGSVGSRWGPRGLVGTPWRAQGVRTSIVHRFGPVERSVEPRRVPSGQNRVPTETCRNPIWPDRTRRIARLSRLDVRLMYGPIWDHRGP